jgi:hypothetical protein
VSSSQPPVPEDSGTTSGRGVSLFRLPSGFHLPFNVSVGLGRIVLLWAAWLVIICSFQIAVEARVQPARPDNVLAWTPRETGEGYPVASGSNCRPLLADPNMNEHVAYDSEYYIAIAEGGYENPNAQAYVSRDGHNVNTGVPTCTDGMDGWTALNYAFMPVYPMTMRPVMAVEGVLPFTSGMTDTGRATLAGIIVSALGGLLAMIALARLMAFLERRRKPTAGGDDAASAEGSWGGAHGLRAALYLLVFPTGFYLAQVYTEGLFLGLAFMACALAVEKKVVWAAAFAVVAALTRQAGFLLFLPIAWAAFEILRAEPTRPKGWRIGVPVAAAVAPVVAFLAWFVSPLGQNWQTVEREFFGRSFNLFNSIDMWHKAWDTLVTGVDQTGAGGGYAVFGGGAVPSSTSFYIALEFLSLALGIAACVWLFRRMPGVALFGLGVIVLSAGSSSAQGMDRYVLAVPAIFLMLASFGRRDLFDRAWVMSSTLLMGLLAMLFTFGFWVS